MEELVEHVLILESSFFGFIATELRRIAYQLAEKCNLQLLSKKKRNSREENGSIKFMKDNPCLCLRTPEATSTFIKNVFIL